MCNTEEAGFAICVGPAKNPGPWCFLVAQIKSLPISILLRMRPSSRRAINWSTSQGCTTPRARFVFTLTANSRAACPSRPSTSPRRCHSPWATSEENGKFIEHFLGRIQGVRLSNTVRYDKDFTPDRRFRLEKDTLALYHFDEGQGDVLKDSSGNNHHGQIVGANGFAAWRGRRARLGATLRRKDLDGWHSSRPADWSVKDSAIVGDSKGTSFLPPLRSDFKDFHLRADEN